jgi:hypothetical protein
LYIQNISTWADEGITVSYTDDNDLGITVTVTDTADNNNDWKAQTNFLYTVRAGKRYKYTFKAWTDSGDYFLGRIRCGYNDDGTSEIYISDSMTSIGKTDSQEYTYSSTIPFDASGEQNLSFYCAYQTGIFKIQIISIEDIAE